MITDRELDAQLAAAAGVQDSDLPPLPKEFLTILRAGIGAPGAKVADREPASVVAARQLVADAHEERTSSRRRRRQRSRLPRRRTALRIGAGVVAAAVAWAVAVVVAGPEPVTTPYVGNPGQAAQPSDRTPGPTAAPPARITVPGGLGLVAAERVTFPLSLDPVPEGLTPTFSRFGGHTPFGEEPVGYRADYRSADGAGFTLWISPVDPRQIEGAEDPRTAPDTYRIAESGTVTVGTVEAEFHRGDYVEPHCTTGRSTPQQTAEPAGVCTDSFADLVWQRPDGLWVHIRGEDAYSGPAAVVAVAESLVDRPQPAALQLGVAPAGWSVTGYDNSQTITVTSDADPDQWLHVWLMERWRPETVEHAFDGMDLKSPVTTVTLNGQPARMAVAGGGPWPDDFWYLAGHLGDGVSFELQMPATFTAEQVFALASQVTYTP